MRETLVSFQGEAELRGLLVHEGKLGALRHPIEGEVQFNGFKALGIEGEELLAPAAFRIEGSNPIGIAVAGCTDKNLRHTSQILYVC